MNVGIDLDELGLKGNEVYPMILSFCNCGILREGAIFKLSCCLS